MVPTQDVHIPTPSIGAVVTFSYESHSRRDEVVNPKIFRIREDVSWEEVVENYATERKLPTGLEFFFLFFPPPSSPFVIKLKLGPTLLYDTIKRMRLFLEKFAKKRNLDPLLPATWYKIPYKDLKHSRVMFFVFFPSNYFILTVLQGGRKILLKFKGHFPALKFLFPDIGLTSAAFLQCISPLSSCIFLMMLHYSMARC
jgi:hypothetical protein